MIFKFKNVYVFVLNPGLNIYGIEYEEKLTWTYAAH